MNDSEWFEGEKSECSETDFTQEKSHFHPTTRIPNCSKLLAAALSQNVSQNGRIWKMR